MKLENLARANELDFLIKEVKNKLEVFVTLKKYYNIAGVFNKEEAQKQILDLSEEEKELNKKLSEYMNEIETL